MVTKRYLTCETVTVLGCINTGHRQHTGKNRKYRVICDRARLGVTIRDKTCLGVKRASAYKEHYRNVIIVTEKSKVMKSDLP
jgi:hypothetical protein